MFCYIFSDYITHLKGKNYEFIFFEITDVKVLFRLRESEFIFRNLPFGYRVRSTI